MDTEEFNNDQLVHLMYGPLALPIETLQIAFPELVERTQKEIDDQFTKILHDPSNLPNVDHFQLNFEIPFDLEEDYQIYTHVIKENESLEDFFKRSTNIFKPIRSAQSIIDRIEYIKHNDNTELINQYTNKLVLDKIFYYSATTDMNEINKLNQARLNQSDFDQCRCAVDTTPRGPVCEQANEKIEFFQPYVGLLGQPKFEPNDLAMLRGENHYFLIRNAAVVLGRNTDKDTVDIDLTYGMDPHCPHISRYQAIISLQPDFNFYIENIGIRPFRINGAFIPQSGVAKLPEGALLDFSGALFIFIPNNELLAKLRA